VRIYTADGIEVQALQGLDLLVSEGELTALVGPSGSGKSTLVNILAGLDAPTAGSVRVAETDLAGMSARERLTYRRKTIGFIWQQTSRNLLPYLTGQQNVTLPMRFGRVGRRDRRSRATELLEILSVAHCADRTPGQMSGGEQQRTAIAVAIANRPQVLLADEPTGELDSATAADVFGALRTVNAETGVTVLIVTHDSAVSAQVRRTVAIRDGRTSVETLRQTTTDEHGRATHHMVEYAVLDRAGRLQLPREMTEPLGLRDRVRLESEPDHIGVWPDASGAAGTAAGQDGCDDRGGSVSGREAVAGDIPGVAGAATMPMVVARELTRTFGSGRAAVRALRGVSFNVPRGQLIAVRGRSGSGKTTLLNIVGGLDRPDGGSVYVGGRDVTAMSERERTMLRAHSVAFIFQSFGLIPILSAAENVGIPLRIAGTQPRAREERVRHMLDVVGLAEHARQRPAELSGGQQQRAAIARALAGSPELLVADEPTGQLDSETGRQIMRLLRSVVRSEGVTALVATHDAALIDIADGALVLADGLIVEG